MAFINPTLFVNRPQGVFYLDDVAYFLKRGRSECLEAEQSGLNALRHADHSLVIPAPIFFGHDQSGHLLVTEGLDLTAATNWRDLGTGLFELHQNLGKSYGWDGDNWIGRDRQCNGWSDHWAHFFTDYRIKPKMERLRSLGFSVYRGNDVVNIVFEYLSSYYPQPSLVHGDLWRGNIGFTNRGASVYDPAVYYGDSQVDIAMTRLFGGFPSEFYEAYYVQSNGFDQSGYRNLIYNFYHILNHAIIFGGQYLEECGVYAKNILRIG